MLEMLALFIFGAIIGSFLNAVIWRIYVSRSVVHGRSKCVHCEHELSAADLIPIASFALLKGKCRYCSKKISWQYPLVEIATGLLFVASYRIFFAQVPTGIVQSLFLGEHTGDTLALIRTLIFLCILIVLFVYDFRWAQLPDSVTLPAIPIAYVLNLIIFSAPATCTGTVMCLFSTPWLSMISAALIGGGFFALQYGISRGAWVGGGDIRLGVVMGVMLGFPSILYALFIAYIVGAAVAVVLLSFKRKKMKSEIPFGPFLCGATAIMLLYGSQVAEWFYRIFGL